MEKHHSAQGLGIHHLFYMDDLKLFAKNDKDLEKQIGIVDEFSKDINMQFGLDKCAKVTLKRGKLVQTNGISLNTGTTIKELDPECSYKYLGINEKNLIEHTDMKTQLRKEYIRRVRKIMETELNSKNKITAINTLAVPILRYSFGIIQWKLSEIKKLDTKTRKMLTINRAHHPKAAVQRLYLPRNEGGRGLLEIEQTFKTEIIGLGKYLESNQKDKYCKIIVTEENHQRKYCVTKQKVKFETEWV
jgi:hypothetical protein